MQLLSGMAYLEAEIVCKLDKTFEKKTWQERIQTFHSGLLYNDTIYKDASDPIGLRAATNAYIDTLEGTPSGYMISLDATASGLQLLSLLVSCQQSWNLCGGNHSQCVDAYTYLYKAMNLGDKLVRADVKKAIMTALYGSQSIPTKVFGEHIDIFYETMETHIPGAWELNVDLQDLWNLVKGNTYSWTMPDNFHCHMETEDVEYFDFNFLGQDYTIKKKASKRPYYHKGLAPNLIHSIDGYIVREMARRCNFNKEHLIRLMDCLDSKKTGSDRHKDQMVITLWNLYRETNILSSRILDYLDEYNMGLVNSMNIAHMLISNPDEPFPIVCIHDNFKCHPNNGNDVRKQYNMILAEINDSVLLNHMARQVSGDSSTRITIRNTNRIKQDNILNSNYSLC